MSYAILTKKEMYLPKKFYMSSLFIGLGLIIYSNFYGPLLKALKANPNDYNAVGYSLAGILAAIIILYFNDRQASQGEFFVFILCAIGSIVRIGYVVFKDKKDELLD